MPSGDSFPAKNRNPDPETGADDPGASQPANADESVDFGSYVSSTVRSSADLFGTPRRSSSSRRRASTEPEPEQSAAGDETPAQARAPRRQGPRETTTGAEAETNRPRRYWRDSVAGESGQNEYDDDQGDDSANGGYGDRIGAMFPWKLPDDGRTRAIIFAAIAVALLALVVLIWFLNRGEDNDAPPPTGTVESVIDAPDTPTESSEGASTPSGFIPFEDEETPEPEATEAVRRGGDNQIDREEPGTPGADLDAPGSADASRPAVIDVSRA